MIENNGNPLDFQNQTISQEYNFIWFASSTHNITNINTMNPVLVIQKK